MRNRTVWAALLLLAVIGVYAPALTGGRVWDDHLLLEENEVIAGRAPWWQAFSEPYLPFEAYYRPVTTLALRALRSPTGETSWPFHLANLLLHLIATLFVHHLARWCRLGPPAALTAAGIFALHPAATEAVAWISGLGDLLAAGLMGMATLAWFRALGRDAGSRAGAGGLPTDAGQTAADRTAGRRADRRLGAGGWAFLSAASFALGLMTKETSVTLLAFLWWLPVVVDRNRFGRYPLRRAALLGLLPQAIILAVYLVLRAAAQKTALPELLDAAQADPTDADPISASLRDPLLRLGLVGRYLTLWIAPVRLHLHHVIEAPRGLADPALWRTFAALGVVAGVTTIAAKRRPRALLPVAWFGASLAPVLLFTPSGTNIFSERYLYIPSIGLAVLLSAGVEALVDLRPRAARTVRGGIVVVLVFLAALTLLRTTQWTDEDRLLRADLRTEPRAAPLAVNLGLHLRNAGREEETLQLYEQTLQAVEAGRPLVLSYLDRDALGRIAYESGLLLLRRGLVDSAETEFRRSLRDRPGDERTLASLGALLGSDGRCEEARPILEGGLRLHPRSVLLRENLALCLMHLGETAQARQIYQEILEIDPDHQTARRVLGGSD